MDNKQKVEIVVWGAVGNAVYDGLKHVAKAAIPIFVLAVTPTQKAVESPKRMQPNNLPIVSVDYAVIEGLTQKSTMPFVNTFLSTTVSSIALVSGDTTTVRGV